MNFFLTYILLPPASELILSLFNHGLSSGPYSVVLKVSLSSHKNCLGPHILFWSLYLFFHKILQWIVYTFSISSYPASYSLKKKLKKIYHVFKEANDNKINRNITSNLTFLVYLPLILFPLHYIVYNTVGLALH